MFAIHRAPQPSVQKLAFEDGWMFNMFSVRFKNGLDASKTYLPYFNIFLLEKIEREEKQILVVFLEVL